MAYDVLVECWANGTQPAPPVVKRLAQDIMNRRAGTAELVEALRLLRSIVREGGVPRYTVIPGAALNSIIEEVVDPLLAKHGRAT